MPQTQPTGTTTAAATEPDPSRTDATAADGLCRCPGCDTWWPAATACRLCVTCDRCDRAVRRADTQRTVRGSRICGTCRARFYWQCRQCDGWNRDGDSCGNGCADPDVYRCSCGCGAPAHPDDTYLVHSYSYRPRPIFRGTGPLFLGPEIELETPYGGYLDCARIATGHLGDLGYLKEDGSIGDGFEIVTHPMSYGWAIANFPWPMLTDLADAGCETPTDTGIHIHLSRAGFRSDCHTYRWMKFIYRNERHVTHLARRSSDQWAAFTRHDRKAVKDYAKGAPSDRYRAINTSNADTFELRVFASSLDPSYVQAVLAFAAASVDYTSDLTAHQIVTRHGWDWTSFTTWLQHRPAYEPLRDILGVGTCAY